MTDAEDLYLTAMEEVKTKGGGGGGGWRVSFLLLLLFSW